MLPKVTVGDNILVPIPSFDRGRGDPSNLLAVVLTIADKKCRVGTRQGVLNTWLERNSYSVARSKIIMSGDVPLDKEFALGAWVRVKVTEDAHAEEIARLKNVLALKFDGLQFLMSRWSHLSELLTLFFLPLPE